MPIGRWPPSSASLRQLAAADGGTLFRVSSSDDNFGFNVGVGVMGHFNDHVGLRGDVRYLRTLTGDVVNDLDLGGFHSWRLSAGLVLG